MAREMGEARPATQVPALGGRVIMFADYFLPGYRAGGPIRSLAGLVERLSDEFNFSIVTSDRDAGSTKPFEGVPIGQWTNILGARILYLPPSDRRIGRIAALLRHTPHDVLYINSLFSKDFGIKPLLLRRAGLIPRVSTILAPRGELSSAALRLGWAKKRAYLMLARGSGVYRHAIWQASSLHEQQVIRRYAGPSATVLVAPNLPPVSFEASPPVERLRAGPLRIVFLARIVPMKNLEGALRMFARVRQRAILDIVGPIEDEKYWERCKQLIQGLPAHLQARHYGVVSPQDVGALIAGYDLYFLPSLGENFGVTIFEALAAGVPVLISDRTPWRGLEKAGAGWDLPLHDESAFPRIIEHVASMSPRSRMCLSQGATRLATSLAEDPRRIELNRELFRTAGCRAVGQSLTSPRPL